MARINKKFAIQLIVTIVVLAFIIPLIEWKESYRLFTSVDLYYLSLMYIVLLLDRWLMAYKWMILLRIKDIHLSNLFSLKLYLIGGFWGEFFPTGLGVDIYRVHALAVKGKSIKDTTSSIIVERLLGFFATTTFAFFGITYVAFFFDDAMMPYFYPIFYVLVIPVLLSLILMRFPVTFHISQLFSRYKDNRIIIKIKSLYAAIMDFKSRPKILWYFYFLSIIEQATWPICTYLGALALGVQVDFLYFLAIVPAMFILLRIPISVQGIGVEEGLFILFLSMIGLSATEAFSLALLVRITRMTLSLGGGALYLREKMKA